MSDCESDDSNIFSVFKYKCSFDGCDLEFRRKDRLDSHEYTHSKVKKFICFEENCGKEYITNSHLQRHKRTAHPASTDNIVYCSYDSCGAYFDSDAKMKVHCHNVHSTKARQFECDICNAKFRRKSKLKQHMFEHTGHYRYACDKCGKGFLQLGHFRRHEKVHQSRKCELCDAIFDKWSLLMAHMQKDHSTTQYKCTVCNKEFHSKRCLRNHRQTHTNRDDRNVYSCSFENCTKFFFQRKNMLAHYKSKHENRKFVCSFEGCTSELSTKQKLNFHIKAVHLGENLKKSKQESTAKKTAKSTRKDKGVQKVSTASKLFNIILPADFEQAIISGQGKNIHINFNQIENEDTDQLDPNSDSDVAKLNSSNLRNQSVVKC